MTPGNVAALSGNSPSPVAEAYRRDGFLVVPNLFSQPTREAVARDLVRTFALRAETLGLRLPARAAADQRTFSELVGTLFDKDIPAYVAAAKLTQHLASVHAMGVSPALLDAIGALGLELPAISTRPVIHYMADRLKIPGGYQKTPPHQDWRSVQGSLDGVTVWSPLYDVTEEDYPLEIIPGSHRRGLLDSTPDMPNYRIGEDHYRESDFRPLTLKGGDAVIFSGFLVHRTGARGADRVRVSFSFRFNNVAEPSFVERNYPNPYLYRADPTIVTPDFPSADALSAVFPGAAR
jgi:phytanoyl-CoA hydroxylase